MNIDENELFTEDIYEHAEQLKQKAYAEARSVSRETIASADIDEVCENLIESYGLHVPEFQGSPEILYWRIYQCYRRSSEQAPG